MYSRIALSSVLSALIVVSGSAQLKEPRPAPVPDYSKEAFIISNHETRLFEESDGSGTREITDEVKILSEAGVKSFAVLNFTYPSANEVLDVSYVRVRKPDGTVVKTPDYNIQDMPADVTRSAPLYSDVHEKHVAVKGLGVGDTLQYLVQFHVTKPQVPGHFWYEHTFAKNVIIQQEKLEINLPAGKYVKIVSPEFTPQISTDSARRVYRWTYSNLQVKEKDPNEIPLRIPPNPSVQVTTFATWEDVGKWYGDLQRDALEITPAIQAKAMELTKGLTSDDEKIRALYNYVSLRFHYVGLDFGIGRYQPHAADDVLGNGYGDCKDKHTLLASLLKAAGFSAWPALIHIQRNLDPDVPSPAQFDHVITVVPTGGSLLWMDTTPEVAPFGLLLRQLRDKQVLVIPQDKPPSLMRTPANAPFPQEQEFSAEGKLSPDGVFSGHIEQSFRGDFEVLLRGAFRQVAQSQWKEVAQGFSYGRGFAGDVSNVSVTPPEDLEKPFQLSYDYVRKNYGDWENHQITPPMPPFGIEVTQDSREKKPLEPILLSGPGEIQYRARVELPPTYSASAPTSLDLLEPYAEYHTSSAIENGRLTTSRRFVMKKREVEVSEWDEFRKFGRKIGDDENKFIPLHASGVSAKAATEEDTSDADEDFQRANEALQRRDNAAAQKLLEKVIKLQPRYSGAHFNLGMALASQGKFDDALAEIRKEEETNPSKIQSYQAAASLARFTGRPEDAIEDWRRLLKADPGNHEATSNLSQLLYSAARYQEEVDLLEATVKASPDDSGAHLSLGFAYLKLGQNDKAVSHIRAGAEDEGDPRPDPMLLNNVAYTLAESKAELDLARRYGEEAVKLLDKQSASSSQTPESAALIPYQFSMLWDTLGWIYFQSGNSAGAEKYIRSAWLLGQDAIVGEHLGEIYEKQGKNREAAHVYELALAAEGSMPMGFPEMSRSPRRSPLPNPYTELHNQIVSHYQKLTGKKPSIGESWRLPNGTWTKTVSEQLSQMRATKLPAVPRVIGSAEFTITFAAGGVESATYLSGDDSLESMNKQLMQAHYQVEFPEGSDAKIIRHAELSCTPSAGCIVVLLPVTPKKAAPFGAPKIQ